MNYTTQMDAARKGILTKELLAVAKKSRWKQKSWSNWLLPDRS